MWSVDRLSSTAASAGAVGEATRSRRANRLKKRESGTIRCIILRSSVVAEVDTARSMPWKGCWRRAVDKPKNRVLKCPSDEERMVDG